MTTERAKREAMDAELKRVERDMAAVNAERIRVIGMVQAARDQYHRKFPDWLLGHYDIWLQFKEAGDRVRARGIREYSAFVIVNVLRYRADTHGRKFSMSNTLVPDLARLYNADHGPLFKVSTRFAKEATNGGAP